jgi:hypothetical protein
MKSPGKKTDTKRIATVEIAGQRLRPWLVAGFVAVCVARVLVPSEAVSWLGDGHPFTMLLLLLTAGCLLLALRRGGYLRPFHLVDAAVAVLVLACVASATLGVLHTLFETGSNPEIDARVTSPRLAVNMLWEWVGLGLVFFLARQLVGTALETRALVAVMIALAVVLSAMGMYQVFVALPAERAAYAENPDAVLRRAGQWYPPDSPQRARFEDRLNSSEPLATFALANSLAGYLAPWLVVAVGVAWSLGQRGGSRARLAGLCACLAATLVCLVLTKSRTAYLALAVGLLLLPLSNAGFRRGLRLRWLAAGGVVLALVILAAVAAGGLDAEVVTEASKSLAYRWEYWQATLDMIADFPILGVGPGDFQNYYTTYKLPQASEEVRDPHNFLLEVWATAGTFAFLALAVALAGFAWQTWRLPASAEEAGDDATTDGPIAPAALRLAVAGGAGVLVAFVVGLPFGFALSIGQAAAAVAVGGCVLATLWPWATGGVLPLRLPALGALVLAIHWLAAGGMTFPGVSWTFWILLALGMNQGQPAAPRASTAGAWRWVSAAALGMTVVAAVACYQTGLMPVLAMRAALTEAEGEGLTDEKRLAALLRAEAADPFSIEPPVQLAQLSLKHLRRDPSSEIWGRQFLSASASIVAQCGHSSAAWREIADWNREIYKLAPTAEIADRIVQLSRGAAYLYPNSAVAQAEYALALEEADKRDAAVRVANKALELDRQTPHADKKLSAPLRQRLEALAGESSRPAATPEAPGVVK